MYRTREEREEHWKRVGGKPDPSNCFNKLGYQTTLKIPAKVDNRLRGKISNILVRTDAPRKMKTLCQESGGVPLKRILVRSDPWSQSYCNRASCNLCRLVPKENQKVSCHQTNIGYGIHCNRAPCKEGDTYKATYQGESSKSGYTRLKNHWDLYNRGTLKAKAASWRKMFDGR